MLAAEDFSDHLFVSPTERRILYILSTYWSTDKSITVSECLGRINELSAATAFKYLKQLREKGYLRLAVDTNDNRVKYVLPTALTEKFFSELGKHLVAAVRVTKKA
jgi:DNA-binding MarR family transcriptional regulator